MPYIFIYVFNMSVTASYVIFAVLLIRFLLKKTPKIYSYLLWGAAAFRLAVPFSFDSVFSIFSLKLFDMSNIYHNSKGTIDYIDPYQIALPQIPEHSVNVGIDQITDAITKISGGAGQQLQSTLSFQAVFSYIWFAVMMLILLYGAVSYILLKRKMANAILKTDNIYESDKVSSPFILGLIFSKIYIPFGLDDETYKYVIAHEKCHLRRYDNYIKAFAFALLAVHWFNPLCWLAFHLMTKDMEMSCDEMVIKENGNINKKYSMALLSVAENSRIGELTPLCFGENNVKSRIKNVLKFKKPAVVVSVITIIICIAVFVACISNPKTAEDTPILSENITTAEEMPPVDEPLKFNEVNAVYVIENIHHKIQESVGGISIFPDKYQPDTIADVTGAEYTGNTGSETDIFKFKYNNITFTISAKNYDGYGYSASIVYYFNGQEYAYTDRNGRLTYKTEIFNSQWRPYSYQPFNLESDDFAGYKSEGTVKNELNGVFRTVDAGKGYAKAIEYTYENNPPQLLLKTDYSDITLLAYIDNNLFFSAEDSIYRMYITYDKNMVFGKEIFYVYYNGYSISVAGYNTLELKTEKETLYLNTSTGVASNYNMANYRPKISADKALAAARKAVVKETNKSLSLFEESDAELFNSNIISAELNSSGHPLYLIEFFDTESASDFYRYYIDAENGDLVYSGLYGD